VGSRAGTALPAVRVRVPATSANLGPGFDTFGLALGIYDEVDVALAADGLVVEVAGEAADEVARDESHLVVSAMLAAFRRWGSEPAGLRVRCRNSIPHARGLGSSAAAIVAGVVAARTLTGHEDSGHRGAGDADLLGLATELEGHPDNVAAAPVGGFTLAWAGDDGARAVRLDPHPDVLPVVCVPGWPMSTATARGLLPAQVPHADAVFTASRAGLLVAALTQAPERLWEATLDRLHQPYRAAAMPPTADLLERLRGRGIPAVLSGAGPSVLALCDRRTHRASDVSAVAGEEWQVRSPGVDVDGVTSGPVTDRDGAGNDVGGAVRDGGAE
jgi:homoserine kinase